ncbi:hypothetical protein, partial [Nostoc sp. 'Peltigera membranacea cyanobiont' 232]|uniref:hypothetical protein n=1 Tax=Nostoc sp. 'Peltigera membranacea cyanobiont' 232 TaxID=2014531 RepID=UPI001CB9D201
MRQKDNFRYGKEEIAERKRSLLSPLQVYARISQPGFLTTPLKARACAGEQGSRGAGERTKIPSSFPSAPLPLCPSAPLLYQTPEACEKCGYGIHT